jgi:hypothetical protein
MVAKHGTSLFLKNPPLRSEYSIGRIRKKRAEVEFQMASEAAAVSCERPLKSGPEGAHDLVNQVFCVDG